MRVAYLAPIALLALAKAQDAPELDERDLDERQRE